LGEQLEVGTEAGQRGSQLVTCVCHQLPLELPRTGNGRQHVVEAGRKAAELIGALDVDRREVTRSTNAFGRPRKAFDRPQTRTRHQQPSDRRHQNAGRADDEQNEAEVVERGLGVASRAREYQRCLRADRHCDDPVARAADVQGTQRLRLIAARDRQLRTRLNGASEPRRRALNPLKRRIYQAEIDF